MNDETPDYLRKQGYSGERKRVDDGLAKSDAVSVDDDDLGYCASRPVAKMYHALAVKRTGKKDRIFEYSHLATSYEGDNERLDLVFAGAEKWVVSIFGRSLLKLLYFIKERRIDWIREESRDAGQDESGKPFIKKIECHRVEQDEA